MNSTIGILPNTIFILGSMQVIICPGYYTIYSIFICKSYKSHRTTKIISMYINIKNMIAKVNNELINMYKENGKRDIYIYNINLIILFDIMFYINIYVNVNTKCKFTESTVNLHFEFTFT